MMTYRSRLTRIERHERTTTRPGAILWPADFLFGPDVDLPGAGEPGMWRWGSRLFTAAEVEELAKTHDVIRIVEVRQDDNQE